MRTPKINNVEDLRAWQAELRGEAKRIETEFAYRFYFLKNNIPAILISQLIPSNKVLSERLGSLLQLLFAWLAGRVISGEAQSESLFERLIQWIQERFSSWFGKGKAASEEGEKP